MAVKYQIDRPCSECLSTPKPAIVGDDFVWPDCVTCPACGGVIQQEHGSRYVFSHRPGEIIENPEEVLDDGCELSGMWDS